MVDVYLHSKKLNLKPKDAIGKGGEADVFRWGKDQVIKLFKPPHHPDYAHNPQEQQAAEFRRQEHQQKLRQFPPNLPPHAIAPQELVYDRDGQTILGYVMPRVQNAEALLRYSQPIFRRGAIGNQQVIQIFQDLYQTVLHLHRLGIVIGDFNDLNILVSGQSAYLIDTDSFQFSTFLCRVFTAQFVDPLLCDPHATSPILTQAHNSQSDWYAFNVLLMQSLLYVHPYGGIYQATQGQGKIPQAARSLHRLSIFDTAVKYPKPATPYQVLPDEWLHHFYQVFVQDHRHLFPRSLLDTIDWRTCPSCGQEIARSSCPLCQLTHAISSPQSSAPMVTGTLTAKLIFQTAGQLLTARSGATLQYLYHENSQFKREGGVVISQSDRVPGMTYKIRDRATLFATENQAIWLHPEQVPEHLAVDAYRRVAQVALHETHYFWLHNGQLHRNTALGGSQFWGDVLRDQTRFWVGSTFGLGYYRAGNLSIVFSFDVQRPGLRDDLALHLGTGQIIDAHCTFSHDRAWLCWLTHSQGQIWHHCAVISVHGQVIAQEHQPRDRDLWRKSLSGHYAVGTLLFVATDAGIVRLEVHQGQIRVTKTFPETEPFVSHESTLLSAQEGLYVVNAQTIYHLAFSN